MATGNGESETNLYFALGSTIGASILMVPWLLCMILIFVYRNSAPIKARSSLFLPLTLLGFAFYQFFSALKVLLEVKELGETVETVMEWMQDLGENIFFLSTFIRAFRVYRIFVHNQCELIKDNPRFLHYPPRASRPQNRHLILAFFIFLPLTLIDPLLETVLPNTKIPGTVFFIVEGSVFLILLLIFLVLLRKVNDSFRQNIELLTFGFICLSMRLFAILELAGIDEEALVIPQFALNTVAFLVVLVLAGFRPLFAVWRMSTIPLRPHDFLLRKLRTQLSRSYFERFLQTDFNVDYLLFWHEVDTFKSNAVDPQHAALIANRFFRAGSTLQKHLPSSLVAPCAKAARNAPSLEVFDEVQGMVFERLRVDMYPRYTRSALYKQYKQEKRGGPSKKNSAPPTELEEMRRL
eukprot:gnl/Trimastix_PCT/2494.p1 GENE.gnl/Trimastix_PCT/2494~~gnl/Trimastix_PCT/2494.p1  ORF type:complete len:409 (-),score=129.97 gnl/Trimastix_PCT/2494:1411-2637(-)